jgi:hypothetical protein
VKAESSYLHRNVETENPDGADHLGNNLQRHQPSGKVPNQLDHVIQHPPGIHPNIGIRIRHVPGRKVSGPGPRASGAEQVAAVGDGGGDRAVPEREDEARVPDADAEREAEVERGERRRGDAEPRDAEVGDARGGGGRVEEEGEPPEEREEQEREGPGREAAEAGGRAAPAQAAEADEHRGAGRRHEDEGRGRGRRWGRGVGGGGVGVVGLLRGLRRREEGLAEVRLLGVAAGGRHRRRGCGRSRGFGWFGALPAW